MKDTFEKRKFGEKDKMMLWEKYLKQYKGKGSIYYPSGIKAKDNDDFLKKVTEAEKTGRVDDRR